jgi:sialate O-acetylesterase
MPERAVREGQQVVVSFAGIAGDLVAQGGPVALGAELCEAAPGTCRFALARPEGARIVLPVPDGMNPTRVRYAWADAPVVNLVDGEGMQVPGFELEIRR